MRLHNKQRYSFFKLFYLLLVLTTLFDTVRASLDGSFGELPMLSPFIMAIGIFLAYRGLPVFEFDSDGEVLIITSKEPFLQPLGNLFVKHSEFPKRKLRGYRIKRFPFRRMLIITIDSKDGTHKKMKFPMSYLRKAEVHDVERSLKRVLKRIENNDEVDG